MGRFIILLQLVILFMNGFAQNEVYSSEYYQDIWNVSTQTPREVRWLLKASDIGNVTRESSWRFKRDLPKDIMLIRHSDYSNSGYDRGHMCPALDRSFSKEAMRQTFRLSNVCPQLHSVNAGSWKSTEIEERRIALNRGRCRVIAMPLYLEKDTTKIGAHGLAVPHAFIKLIYDTNPDTLYHIYFIWNK